MNKNPIPSLAGIWQFNLSSIRSGLVDFYSVIHTGTSNSQGIVLGGWAIPAVSLVAPMQTTIAILDQNPDGTLCLNTAKYISDAITNGVGSIVVSDFNGDSIDDIFMPSYNEFPFANLPTIVYLSNQGDAYIKKVLPDDTAAHSAVLSELNGVPTVITSGYSGKDPFYQFDPINNTFIIHYWNGNNPSSVYGSSAITGDFLGDGQSELVVVDTNNALELGPFGPSSIVLNRLNGNIYHYDEAVVLPTPYFTNNSYYPNASTHQYRVWTEDFNHDKSLDLLIAESTAAGIPMQASKLQMLQNQGSLIFVDMTDDLGAAYLSTTNNVDYSMQRVDLDESGINTYLLGDSPLGSQSTHSNYLLLNDGTGRMYAALHDEFISWGSQIKAYLDASNIKYNQMLFPKFIGYQLSDGAINYLVNMATGDGFTQALVNLPVHYNISADFTQDVIVSDRNNSLLMRTWAGNDIYRDAGANVAAAHIDGGLGMNTCIYSDSASNYAISSVGIHRFEVKHLVLNSAPHVDDTLVNISRLQFTDTMLALDIGPNQTAGAIYMLYQATFNRTPDKEGLGYWIDKVDKGADITKDVAAFFVTSGEFVSQYGANPSNASYVDNLYLNVLHRPGEAGGVAFWNQVLNEHRVTRAEVLQSFATLAEGAALVAADIAHGIEYQQWVG
jgi:hypothetical protein